MSYLCIYDLPFIFLYSSILYDLCKIIRTFEHFVAVIQSLGGAANANVHRR